MGKLRALLAAGGLVVALAGCWPMPGQNADRTSHNPFERSITSDNVGRLHQLWRWDSPDPNVFGPVTSSAGVHVVVPCGMVTLDAATGAERWRGQIPPDASVCSLGITTFGSEPYVTADGDRVIGSFAALMVRPPGFLVAEWDTKVFDAATGAADGSAPVGFIEAQRGNQLAGLTQGPVGPALTATVLHLGGLDAAPGRDILTETHGTAPVKSDGALTLGSDVVFHSGTGIMATTLSDGTQGYGVRAFSISEARPGCGSASHPMECPLWVTPTDGRPTAAVLGGGGATAFVRTNAGTLYALDAATGAVRWTAGGLGAAGSPALAGGTLYVPTGDGRIVTFDAAGCGGATTCTPTGSFATGATGAVSSPAVAGDVLYATAGGSVFAFEAAACPAGPCEPLWSAPGSAPPVVSNGRVYVHSDAGLIAYGLPSSP